MTRSWFVRILAVALPLLVAGAAVAAMPVYRYVTEGRPLCVPHFTRRGDEPAVEGAELPNVQEVNIPAQEDWVDYGAVLETGAEGDWDFYWAGITPASVVKKDGTIFFYYVAADGYRSFDGDARHRSVGVATSHDGIRFTKYSGNPIMEHRPYDGEEEGANSAAITLDENGRFVMVYGAASGPHSSIVADARYAFSDDGLRFNDAGRALYHCDVSVYGAGDEIFPVALLRQPERWVVYYHPNGGRGTERTLGAAWGKELNRLNNSTAVLDSDSGGWPVGAWGNIVVLDEETLALFAQRLWWPDTFVEARVASPKTPYQLSESLVRYDIPNLKRGVVFLDKERRTWFMYYNDFSRFWHVKLAPFGERDAAPPSKPEATARPISEDSVRLQWREARDPDTGVVEYRIYRNGRYLARTQDLWWVDERLRPNATYRYQVTAINFHGAESPAGEVAVRTMPDHTPPTINSVTVTKDLTKVNVAFSEPVNREMATEVTRYEISGGIVVSRARLAADNRRLILQTTPHNPGAIYQLTVRGVSDQASAANSTEQTQIHYTASAVPRLAGRWLYGNNQDAEKDLSGFGITAVINGAKQLPNGNGALLFDGVDDYVQIPGVGHLRSVTTGSFSFTVWLRPNDLQMSGQGARIFGRVGEHPAGFVGLALTPDAQIEATLIQEDEVRTAVRSAPVTSGRWYHVAMVVDTVDMTLTLFVDGEVKTKNFAGGVADLSAESPRDDRSGAYFIATTMPDRGAGSFFDAYFSGAVRDVRIYDRALSAGDVQVIRQN